MDNSTVLRRVATQEVTELALDYDLYMVTQAWLAKITYKIQWCKVDSHINEKLLEDPMRVLKGDKLAWRLGG